jgi:hypothetical protein
MFALFLVRNNSIRKPRVSHLKQQKIRRRGMSGATLNRIIISHGKGIELDGMSLQESLNDSLQAHRTRSFYCVEVAF